MKRYEKRYIFLVCTYPESYVCYIRMNSYVCTYPFISVRADFKQCILKLHTQVYDYSLRNSVCILYICSYSTCTNMYFEYVRMIFTCMHSILFTKFIIHALHMNTTHILIYENVCTLHIHFHVQYCTCTQCSYQI